MKPAVWNILFFCIGVGAFILGAYLVSELFFKFVKFFVGFILILLSIQLMFGSLNAFVWRRRMRHQPND
ncbi:hypothetical protein HZB03_02880 [Candidatus Woesearchaeota archaeon]|nr:hypothetical protein [Candidatus Woesearchaeota archaeon]